MLRPMVPVLTALGVLWSCTSCGDATSTTPTSASTEELQVVASVYPMQYVAQRVAGEHATVTTLTSPGQEPHDLELSPAGAARIEDADLALYVGGLQPAVDEALEGHEQAVDAYQLLSDAASTDPELVVLPDNPHLWLDPLAMRAVTAAVGDRLAEADPEHAEQYRRNAAALEDDLSALDRRFTAGLARCAVRTIVVNHDAFGYLGARYRLDVQAINGLSPDAEPSPAHLAELQQLVRRERISTVFTETLASPELADSLAGDLGIATAVLDPIEGLSDATADEDYLTLMERDLAALVEANDCTVKAR